MKPFILLVALFHVIMVEAQWPVPFVDDDGRFVVFANGRFERLEKERPLRYEAQDGQVIYTDAEGRLKIFLAEGRRLHLLHRGPVDRWQVAGGRAAWRSGDTLFVLREARGVPVAYPVDRFDVTDSLVVFNDLAAGELRVLWRGQVLPIATVTGASERAQWQTGNNTVTFYDRSTMKLFLFQGGQVELLTDSADMGLVANGGGVVGYWDDVNDRFMLRTGGTDHRISDLRPVSAKAGEGVLAFVDGIGKLRCWMGGRLHTLLQVPPTDYWVQDSLLLYLHEGRLELFAPSGPLTVEDYVPERWAVNDARLVYLDIDRRLRSVEGGRRERLGTEAAIPTFDLFGDAVLYPAPSGPWTVIQNGRLSLY
ncbi:MAG: hypothetical protein R2817_07040 [Flavobacteriales bacterium]